MSLYLIRHGETAHNRDGLGLGSADVALTDQGQQQAKAIATRFADEPLARVLASPLRRASFIAEVLAASTGADLTIREELVEMDVGQTEHLAFAEMGERFPDFLAEWRAPDPTVVAMPGGESLADVDRRLLPLIEELQTAPDDSGAIAVVSHNFVLRILVCRLLGLELAAFRSFATDLASVSKLTLRSGHATIEFLNDRCHLPDPG